MEKYTAANRVFREVIDIPTPRDNSHANNITLPMKQLLENTMALKDVTEEILQNGVGGGGGGYTPTVENETLIFAAGTATVQNETLIFNGKDGTTILPQLTVMSIASETELGGVKIGRGLNISADGTISANMDSAAEVAAELVESRMIEVSQEEVKALYT